MSHPAPDALSLIDAHGGGGGAYLACEGSLPIALSPDFPRATYRSRGQEVKTAVHWGQRKLLISEMQLLSYFCEPRQSYWIVYVGAAPGSHLMFLDDLYDGLHEWELIDPGQWDHRYSSLSPSQRSRFTLRNEFFDNAQAYELAERRLRKAGCPALSAIYGLEVADAKAAATTVTEGDDAEAARTTDIPIRFVPPVCIPHEGLSLLMRVAGQRCRMLFISDIRSGSEKACAVGEFDLHVHENMLAQEAWTDIVNPSFAMLKFRLPYSFTSRYDFELKRQVQVPSLLPPTTTHSSGTLLLPVWTRPTSTECRLVVPAFAGKTVHNHQQYEDQMFFFNAVLRERVHFAHGFNGHEWVDHRYDGAAEVRVLETFLRTHKGLAAATPYDIGLLVDRISAAIGSSFERAYANRENIHVQKGVRAGWIDATEQRLRLAREKRLEPLWHRALGPSDKLGEKAIIEVADDAAGQWSLHTVAPAEGALNGAGNGRGVAKDSRVGEGMPAVKRHNAGEAHRR